jgi:Calcineurin-like phosphoesterase
MIATDSDPKDGDFADQTKTGDAAKVTSGADPGPPQNPSPNAAVSVASDAARPADAQTQLEATALPEIPAVESGALPPVRTPPRVLPVVDVTDLDWVALRDNIDIEGVRHRMCRSVSQMEDLLSRTAGARMLFDLDRSCAGDRAVRVAEVGKESPLWFIGDLHGDLLALEAALLLIRSYSHQSVSKPRIVFLGDLFDDEGFGLEVLLRVFELILENPALVCVIAGNHDEALSYDGTRFTSDVSPSDFSEYLNTHSDDEWITRAGKLAVRLFSQAARALFFPDGLLVAHGGFPLTDLHAQLQNNGDWNNPACLSDFVWTRAHPTARKKIPNRFARGSQFGYEDFAAFCLVASALGRPVTHMVRGHDHVEQRFAVYPAYSANPILTTVALARRLPRELFGTHERAPTLALYIEGALPQVFRLHVPADLIAKLYPERLDNCNVQLEQSPT